MATRERLRHVTFSQHGFNQGIHYLHELCLSNDIVLMLPLFNLNRVNESVPNVLVFAPSAMNDAVTAGVLRGRSFGDEAILVGSKFKRHVKLIAKSSRYIIIKIGFKLIVNVYLPC